LVAGGTKGVILCYHLTTPLSTEVHDGKV